MKFSSAPLSGTAADKEKLAAPEGREPRPAEAGREDCEKQKEEYLAGWQRARADLLNFKKEEMDRVGEVLKYANEDFILRVIPILDNFELIEKKLPETLKKDDNVKGLLMIRRQLEDFLKNSGVEEIKSMGEKFDASWHEVAQASEEKGREPGIIIEQIQKGYKINGRLLRPAKVKIIK